jgi:hypothetical protein
VAQSSDACLPCMLPLLFATLSRSSSSSESSPKLLGFVLVEETGEGLGASGVAACGAVLLRPSFPNKSLSVLVATLGAAWMSMLWILSSLSICSKKVSSTGSALSHRGDRGTDSSTERPSSAAVTDARWIFSRGTRAAGESCADAAEAEVAATGAGALASAGAGSARPAARANSLGRRWLRPFSSRKDSMGSCPANEEVRNRAKRTAPQRNATRVTYEEPSRRLKWCKAELVQWGLLLHASEMQHAVALQVPNVDGLARSK